MGPAAIKLAGHPLFPGIAHPGHGQEDRRLCARVPHAARGFRRQRLQPLGDEFLRRQEPREIVCGHVAERIRSAYKTLK
jgi:hypothetical protein